MTLDEGDPFRPWMRCFPLVIDTKDGEETLLILLFQKDED
jgi:hypothetical protein